MTAVVIQNPNRLGYIKRDKKRYTLLRERRRYPALWAKAGAVPSLDLRFADNKSLVDAVTGQSLVTFTRASSGTFTDSAGVLQTAVTDVPRFDHNPTTGESLGLLVEEARTNLVLRSAAISTSPWAGNGTETCVASTLTDPAGGLNAFKINLGAASFEQWQQPITVVNGTTYTLSAWVRSTSGTTLFRLRFAGGTTSSDLTATTTWQRFTYTLTAGTTAGFFAFNSPSTGAAAEIHVYGAQLEAGAFPTSYIPTTTAAATRSADVASITGSAFSGFYNQSEGTVFADARYNTIAGNTGIVSIYDSASPTNNRHSLRIGNTLITSGGTQVAGFTQTPVLQAVAKYAYGYATNNFCQVLNSTTIAVDTSGALPVDVNAMDIGKVENASFQSNGTIRRICFWPQRLANSVLQNITQ
jgi:hypothetical protein